MSYWYYQQFTILVITKTTGQNNNFYNTLYRPQQVDKQRKDVSNGELQFRTSPVPNQASVLQNGDMNLEQSEHCSARVPIQPGVQECSYEQNLSSEHDFQKPQLPVYRFAQVGRWKES